MDNKKLTEANPLSHCIFVPVTVDGAPGEHISMRSEVKNTSGELVLISNS